ncbi:hypothetical protein [Neorhizobium sp. NCHU2750]|uniref:hypothetical protein n=1 Tax=Neorhizobium sp. NCHU2750 TaxID=1825976 RepID=UPI000EB779AE|nr:hypothetical protein NCHU2750_30750 [Neorhizobium sp. NCHU2750]
MTRDSLYTDASRPTGRQLNVASSCGTGEALFRKEPSLASIEINRARKAQGVCSNVERDEHVADAGDIA